MELARLCAVVVNLGEDYVCLWDKVIRYKEEMEDWAFDYSDIPELKFGNDNEPQAQEPQPQPQGAGAGPHKEGENMGIDQ
jgi:hypothetical protein